MALFRVKKCFQGHSPKIKTILHIFDHTIKPILLYGSEMWGSFPAQKLLTQGDNYFSKVCRDLIAEKSHFKLCKYSIKVGGKAANSAVMGELGRYPLFLEVLLNMIKYWVYLSKINTSSTLLSECLLLSEALHKQNKKSWYASVDTILKYLNVSAKSILTTKRNIKSYFYSKLKPKYNAVWKTGSCNDRPGKQYGNKLRTYRLFKNNFAIESYFNLDNFNRNILIRFRISAHSLEIEKGRHQNIPLNERICKLCKLEIEDEIHCLLQCPILNSFRTEAMQQISDICKIFASLDNKSKFIWLLSNENIIIINIVIKLLMSLTETRTKLLSGGEGCLPGSLPSSHCIITSNIVV
jgi:hypothetical protein